MSGIFESDSDEDVAIAAAAFVVMSGHFLRKSANDELLRKQMKALPPPPVEKISQSEGGPVKRKRNRRRMWMSAKNKSRKRYSASDMLADLKKKPSGAFEEFCGMSATDFENLLAKIGPLIVKEDTLFRKSIPVQERFAVTLRYLTTGEFFSKLSYLFRFSTQTVSRCIDEVCKALMQVLQEEIKFPQNEDAWLAIAQDFQSQWNFPNCLGAIEEKSVVLPNILNNSEKESLNMVLLALVDARSCFTFVDIECQDGISDGGVFKNSSLYSKMKNGELKFPPDAKLPGSDKVLPHVFLGDSTFTLSHHIMRPYPEENDSKKRFFNYRLSHARRVADNAFGVMSSVFRVLRKPILLQPEKIHDIVLSCILLHNYLSRSTSSSYAPPVTFDSEADHKVLNGLWGKDDTQFTTFKPVKKVPKMSGEVANATRDSFAEYFNSSFAEYFNSSGKLPEQNEQG